MADRHYHREQQRKRLQAAIARNPRDAESHYNYASFLWRDCRDSDGAITEYQAGLRLAPSVEALNQLALVYKARQSLDDAARLLRDALERKPHYCRARRNLGLIASERGDLDEAIKLMRHALADDPNDAASYWNVATLVLRKDSAAVGEAAAALEEGLAVDPTNTVSLRMLAELYLQQSTLAGCGTTTGTRAFRANPPMARILLQLAVDSNPDCYRTWTVLGKLLRDTFADPDQALRCFERVLGCPRVPKPVARDAEHAAQALLDSGHIGTKRRGNSTHRPKPIRPPPFELAAGVDRASTTNARCSQGHVMLLVRRKPHRGGNTWSCDLCSRGINAVLVEREGAYHCPSCDSDMCPTCVGTWRSLFSVRGLPDAVTLAHRTAAALRSNLFDEEEQTAEALPAPTAVASTESTAVVALTHANVRVVMTVALATRGDSSDSSDDAEAAAHPLEIAPTGVETLGAAYTAAVRGHVVRAWPCPTATHVSLHHLLRVAPSGRSDVPYHNGLHEAAARSVMCRLLDVLAALHKSGMSHGNLSLHTVFTSPDCSGANTTLTAVAEPVDDFACRAAAPPCTGSWGNVLFAPPEVILAEARDVAPDHTSSPDTPIATFLPGSSLRKAADVWSLACIWASLLTGRLPWQRHDDAEAPLLDSDDGLVSFVLRVHMLGAGGVFDLDCAPYVSPAARGLLDQCFVRHPETRPTVHDLLQHPYFCAASAKAAATTAVAGIESLQHHAVRTTTTAADMLQDSGAATAQLLLESHAASVAAGRVMGVDLGVQWLVLGRSLASHRSPALVTGETRATLPVRELALRDTAAKAGVQTVSVDAVACFARAASSQRALSITTPSADAMARGASSDDVAASYGRFDSDVFQQFPSLSDPLNTATITAHPTTTRDASFFISVISQYLPRDPSVRGASGALRDDPCRVLLPSVLRWVAKDCFEVDVPRFDVASQRAYTPLSELVKGRVVHETALWNVIFALARHIDEQHSKGRCLRRIHASLIFVPTRRDGDSAASRPPNDRQYLVDSPDDVRFAPPELFAPAGPQCFFAAEMLAGQYTSASDVYAMGVTMLGLLVGGADYVEAASANEESSAASGAAAAWDRDAPLGTLIIPSHVSWSLRRLLLDCTNPTPRYRPSAAAVLESRVLKLGRPPNHVEAIEAFEARQQAFAAALAKDADAPLGSPLHGRQTTWTALGKVARTSSAILSREGSEAAIEAHPAADTIRQLLAGVAPNADASALAEQIIAAVSGAREANVTSAAQAAPSTAADESPTASGTGSGPLLPWLLRDDDIHKVVCHVEGFSDIMFVAALCTTLGMHEYRDTTAAYDDIRFFRPESTKGKTHTAAHEMRFQLDSSETSPASLLRTLDRYGNCNTETKGFLFLRDNDLKVVTTKKANGQIAYHGARQWWYHHRLRWGRAIENYLLPWHGGVALWATQPRMAFALSVEVLATVARGFFPSYSRVSDGGAFPGRPGDAWLGWDDEGPTSSVTALAHGFAVRIAKMMLRTHDDVYIVERLLKLLHHGVENFAADAMPPAATTAVDELVAREAMRERGELPASAAAALDIKTVSTLVTGEQELLWSDLPQFGNFLSSVLTNAQAADAPAGPKLPAGTRTNQKRVPATPPPAAVIVAARRVLLQLQDAILQHHTGDVVPAAFRCTPVGDKTPPPADEVGRIVRALFPLRPGATRATASKGSADSSGSGHAPPRCDGLLFSIPKFASPRDFIGKDADKARALLDGLCFSCGCRIRDHDGLFSQSVAASTDDVLALYSVFASYGWDSHRYSQVAHVGENCIGDVRSREEVAEELGKSTDDDLPFPLLFRALEHANEVHMAAAITPAARQGTASDANASSITCRDCSGLVQAARTAVGDEARWRALEAASVPLLAARAEELDAVGGRIREAMAMPAANPLGAPEAAGKGGGKKPPKKADKDKASDAAPSSKGGAAPVGGS